jgi:hypothetical protein
MQEVCPLLLLNLAWGGTTNAVEGLTSGSQIRSTTVELGRFYQASGRWEKDWR